MGDPIHIVLTFSDNYWAPAYATMRSVCYFTHRRGDLVFHLIHLGLADAHKADLDQISTEYRATIRHYDLSQTNYLTERIAGLRVIDEPRFHTLIYARLFLFEILPKGIGRLIYLDSDVFVRINIERLYDMDLGDNIAAAAMDPYRTAFQLEREGVRKPHFDSADPYFNSGVILFGEACAEIDFLAELKARLPPEELSRFYYDQDALNLVLAGRWHVLSHRWNLQNPTVADENKDPFIVHYTGPNKPWHISSKTAFKPRYRHMMTNALYSRYWWFNFRRNLRASAAKLTCGLWRP